MQVAVLGARRLAATPGRPRSAVHARSQRAEDRVEVLHDGVLAADHQAESALQPEDPAARADVNVVDAMFRKPGGTIDVVAVVAVPAVDDDVLALHGGRQLLHGGPGERGRNHHPRGPRRAEPGDEVVDRRRRDRALRGELLRHLGIDVVHDTFMAVPHQAADQVGPHASQPHHSQLHATCPPKSRDGRLHRRAHTNDRVSDPLACLKPNHWTCWYGRWTRRTR